MSNMLFSIQTLKTDSGGTLKGIKPNKDGFFEKVPIGLIGVPSRNNKLYDPNSVVAAMADERSRFFKNLAEGNLEGEWCHPMLIGFNSKDEMIQRVLTVDRTRLSHYFRRVWSEPSRCGKFQFIYGDLKACGTYGPLLTESFEDPHRNTAFSLRSLTSQPRKLPDGTLSVAVMSMVTFDAEGGPGFKEASKRYMHAVEGLEGLGGIELGSDESDAISVTEVLQFPDFAKVVGYEAIQCQEVLDRLQSEKVYIGKEAMIRGTFDSANNCIVTEEGEPTSIFHTIF